MKRILFILILGVWAVCYAANIDELPEFSEETLPIHIENIRRINEDFRNLDATADILSVSVETLEASVETLGTAVSTLEDTGLNSSIKGWVNFNGAVVTATQDMTGVADSYNVSAVVDNGTGDYTIHWDTDFASTKYVVVGTAYRNGSTMAVCLDEAATPPAAASVKILTKTLGDVAQDPTVVAIMAIGDQ